MDIDITSPDVRLVIGLLECKKKLSCGCLTPEKQAEYLGITEQILRALKDCGADVATIMQELDPSRRNEIMFAYVDSGKAKAFRESEQAR